MGREFELKFAATPCQQEQIAAEISNWDTIAMETTYFDTPDGFFAAGKMTLRRRLENGRSICTLKTPDAGHGRGEWDLECDDIREALPVLCKLSGLRSVPDPEGLIPTCGARFTRRCAEVSLEDGTAELALDRGVLMGGGREIPLCEVEVEQKTGSEAATVAFAQALSHRFGLIAEPRSKFRRALALGKGE